MGTLWSELGPVAEAVSWGKVNPSVLPDTAVAYCDSTIAFPLFCEYAVGSANNRRPRKELVRRRAELIATLKREATAAGQSRPSPTTFHTISEVDRDR